MPVAEQGQAGQLLAPYRVFNNHLLCKVIQGFAQVLAIAAGRAVMLDLDCDTPNVQIGVRP